MKKLLVIILSVMAMLMAFTVPAVADVTPSSVDEIVPAGGSIVVEKTVDVPEILPQPDIYFLADTTGSMGGAIANVQANASNILNTISGQDPTAQFGAGDYKDFPYDGYAFQNTAPIDGDAPALAAIAGWSASGGADGSEGWFYALYQLATDPGIGWRVGSTRIVVIFGDAPAHDPVPAAATGLGFDLDEAAVIAALQAAGIHVIAVSLDTGFYPAGLNDNPTLSAGDYAVAYPGYIADGSAGQASRIATATDGVYLFAASEAEVSDAILEGLGALTTDVWWEVTSSSPYLTVTLDPAVHLGVTSGTSVVFTETIEVSADAPQCDDPSTQEVENVLTATVTFKANTYPEEGQVIGIETITITVPDTTRPTVASVETVNPAGNKIPPAGNTTLPGPKGGMNEDGFYVLTAEDNCDENPDIYVSDDAGNVFGPFASGTVVKFTEASAKAVGIKAIGGPDSAVQWHITLSSDATVVSVDDSGNVSDLDFQLVPPLPK